MPLLTIDTAAVAEPDRLDFWRSTVCDQFVTLDVAPASCAPVAGRVTAGSVDGTHLRRIAAGPHRFVRTPRQVRSADEDYLQVALARRGRTVVSQDGREAVIGPGELVVYDSSRPYAFATADRFEYSVCLHPKSRLPLSRAELSAVTATPLGGRGVAALVPPLLSALDGVVGEDVPEESRRALSRTVGDLLVALVRGQVPAASTDNLHLVRARAHLRRHLGDPDLGPAQVAAACAISVRYLHRLFAAEGASVAEEIRDARLQGAWEDLRRPDLAHRGIGVVAARWGMPDPAAFSRAFRARFGRSPRDHRAAWT